MSASASGAGCACGNWIVPQSWGAANSVSMSSGSASTTGPGRPDIATEKARFMYSVTRAALSICATHLLNCPNMRR
ncbi:hypothetical protein D3C81_1813850 [compost metagenome]